MRPALEMVSSGIPELDALTGGWPRGCLSEICGSASSGRTSIALAALAQATQRGEACALVDASDALDPVSAAAAGVEMGRLLWIRCGRQNSPQRHRDTGKVASGQWPVVRKAAGQISNNLEENFSVSLRLRGEGKNADLPTAHRPLPTYRQCLEQVLKITDLLLQSNGFGVIVLDLADIPVLSARRIPLASWFRFRRAVEHTPTVLLVIEQQPIAGSCSSLLVKVTGQRLQVTGARSQTSGLQCKKSEEVSRKKPSAFSHQQSANRYTSSRPAASKDQEILCARKTISEKETSSSAPSHTELLDRFEITAELLRSRLERKPAQSAAKFRSRAKWAG